MEAEPGSRPKTKDSESDLEEGRWSQPQKTQKWQACDIKMAWLVRVLAMQLELDPRNSHKGGRKNVFKTILDFQIYTMALPGPHTQTDS